MKLNIKTKIKKEFGDLVAKNYDKVRELAKELLWEFSFNCQYKQECAEFSQNCWKCFLDNQEALIDFYTVLKQFALLTKIKEGGEQ